MSDIKVSVAMITYNQERYIGEAIDSILCQQVNFEYEIVIGEDCSTDTTLSICREYQKKVPDKIRLLDHGKNLGIAANFLTTVGKCQGKYLAILEGDDLWVNPLKLQKQVDYLESHPDCSLVFGKTQAFYQDGDRPGYDIPVQGSGPYTLENLLHTNFIATCSVMYRVGLVNAYPEWLSQLQMQDWPLHVLHAQRGKIGFINEPFAKYRIHKASSYSSHNVIRNFMGMLKFYETINRHLEYQYCNLIYARQAWVYRELFARGSSRKERGRYLQKAIWYKWLSWLPSSALTRWQFI
jgi:glycosyltransferase involved in cell wall biosynthesis